ncbi:MAG: monofunctional biosynthetic peptidoglycan transglycosylase [Parvibaculaceae bacterium]
MVLGRWSRRGSARIWLRRAGWTLVALAALPFLLALIYRFVPPPVSALMLLRAAGGAGIDYRWAPFENISAELPKAVVAAEDAGLCSHGGVEWGVLQDVVQEAVDGEKQPSRGGSTIPMQVAKNLFLWPSRSYVRKGLELPLAIWIDLVWPKRRVVEVYLNIAEWAPGIYGAEAASQHHFKKPASKLTRREASLLAAALPNPLARQPGKPGRGLSRYARRIAARVPSTEPLLGCLGL